MQFKSWLNKKSWMKIRDSQTRKKYEAYFERLAKIVSKMLKVGKLHVQQVSTEEDKCNARGTGRGRGSEGARERGSETDRQVKGREGRETEKEMGGEKGSREQDILKHQRSV